MGDCPKSPHRRHTSTLASPKSNFCASSPQPCVKLSPTTPAPKSLIKTLLSSIIFNALRLKSHKYHVMGSSDPAFNQPPQQSDSDATLVNSEPSEGGVVAGVKSQINSMTGGKSVAELQDQAVGIAKENAVAVKETVMDSAVPAAGEALQNVGNKVRELVGVEYETTKETIEEEIDQAPHPEQIDNMDEEKLCDFLREKHSSTAPPPKTN
ncbi:hypothetical protein N7478_008567 [Penicillium angulare]|uniref:uncharacterized protein n=1 Tax=Penicillium angulare TaxID=116970 RepID=UPI002541F07F|nr:uncharacterized protein N7478_008567 [Penicillium angulare]KAJ5273442.1 hypothetical protein N7478_008567 [Penicillium angulare]